MKARVGVLLSVTVVATIAFVPPASAFVYWGDGVANTLGRANLNGTGADVDFIEGIIQGPREIAADDQHLYWSNRNENTIERSNLDGTGVDHDFITGANDPRGVAVDDAHVYWVNSDGDEIARADIDGTDPDQNWIGTASAGQARLGVAVDAAHVYWTNAAGAIGRADLNGDNPDKTWVVADSPADVAVDNTHVYWANFTQGATAGAIGRADLDGSDPDDAWIPSPNASNPTAVAVDAAHVYWTNAGLPNTIGRANLNGTSPNRDFITGLSFLAGLEVDSLSVPSCQGTSASTGHAEPVEMTLPCTSGGGARTFAIRSQPGHGEISGLNSSTGTLTYTPDAGFNGTDTFTYRVSNPGAISNTASASIGVAARNDFEIGKPKRNRRRGTAKLPVEVPGAGEIELAKTKKTKGASETADAASTVTLPVKARGKARKKLAGKGKANVAAEVTFAPVGGEPTTQTETVKLVKK